LGQGFTADNLGSAATLAFESSWNAPSPLGLFVVTRVLRILADHWDVDDSHDQARMTSEALVDMERRLRPPLVGYLEAIDQGRLEAAAELDMLDAIVRALFEWTAERPDPGPGPGQP
jgi:hypothetical protein